MTGSPSYDLLIPVIRPRMSKERKEMSETRCVRPKELAQLAGVRSQMVYNYISAGRIPAVRCSDHNDQLCVDMDDAQEWLDAREAKAKVKYDKIQRQLRGEV